MLILAGISINAIVGDSGIISRAQSARYLQSVAVLQEYLQQKYVEYVEDADNYNTALDLLKSKQPQYFYRNNQGYVLDSEGHALYLINKEGLPVEIKNQLTGGDAIYANEFYSQKNVYGVTSDLQVYYCTNGTDTIVGLSKEDLDKDNPLEIIYDADSILAQIVNGGTSGLSNQDLKSIIELTIDSNDKVPLITELKNLHSLKTLTLKDVSISKLSGIEDCTKLSVVNIQNCTVEDYSKIADSSTITAIYLINTNDEEVNKFTDIAKGIGGKAIPNLKYLGIYGSSSNISTVTDISGLANLEEQTQAGIEYLYLQNNSLTSLSALSGYTGTKYLKVEYNKTLTSLNGISGMSNLEYLYAMECNLGYELESNSGANEAIDSISGLAIKNLLYYVDLRNNPNLKYVKYLGEAHKKADSSYGDITLEYVYLSGCTSVLDVSTITNVLANCGSNYNIENQFSKNIIADNTVMLNLNNQTLTKSEFEQLKDKKQLKYLSIDGIKLKNNDGSTMSNSDINDLINTVLSTNSNLENLSSRNITALETIEFVKSTPNLIEILLSGTKVTTGKINGLELLNVNCPYLVTLAADEENIDLSKIQPCLNKTVNTIDYIIGKEEYERLWIEEGKEKSHWLGSNNRSSFTTSKKVLATIVNCHDLEHLVLYDTNNGTTDILDMSGCTNLKALGVQYGYLIAKLPSSLIYYHGDNSGGFRCDFSLCNKLEYINLWNQNGNQVAFNNIVEDLNNNTELQYICLDRFYIDDLSAIRVWNNKTKLKEVKIWDDFGNYYKNHYDGSRLTFTTLNGLENLTNLENLTIGWNNAKLDISALSNLTNLVNLELNDNYITDISPLKNLINLEKLNLHGNDITDISALLNMSKLQVLDISSNKVSCLYPIANAHKINKLNIKDNVLYNYGYYTDENGNVRNCNNVSILGELNSRGSLEELYIENNFMDDLEPITDEKLTWTDKSGF